MRRCEKCKREIYKRTDKVAMVRAWGMYNDRYDWRDKYHKCKQKRITNETI